MSTREEKLQWAKLDEIEDRLKKLEAIAYATEAVRIEFYTYIGGIKQRITNMFLKVTQKLPITVGFKDAQGNPAKVDGIPQWAIDTDGLGALAVADDGMSAVFTPTGVIGACKVQVSADADLGEGVKQILGFLDVEMLSGEAVTVEMAAGEPVDI